MLAQELRYARLRTAQLQSNFVCAHPAFVQLQNLQLLLTREMILATIDHCGGNKRRAAEILGVSLKTLYNRLAAYQAGESRIAASLPG